jgi:hypothetical protein
MNDMHLAPMDLPRPNMSRPDRSRRHNTSISLFTHAAYVPVHTHYTNTLTSRNDFITTSDFADYLTACTSDDSKKFTTYHPPFFLLSCLDVTFGALRVSL